MTDFRVLAAAGRWEEVEWLWLSQEEQSEFLELVRDRVPFVEDENGMEKIQRRAHPDEVGDDRSLIEAAKILYLGELEAAVEGEPPDDNQIWSGLRAEIEDTLAQLCRLPEVTEGSESLSRKQHAVDAMDYLAQIDVGASWMRNQLDEDDIDWFDQTVAAVAWKAFLAGRHAQAAFMKAIEVDALRGEKVAGGSRNSAQNTNRRHEDLRKRRFARMEQLVRQLGVDRAAAQCSSEGLGSWEAIKKQWNRRK